MVVIVVVVQPRLILFARWNLYVIGDVEWGMTTNIQCCRCILGWSQQQNEREMGGGFLFLAHIVETMMIMPCLESNGASPEHALVPWRSQ